MTTRYPCAILDFGPNAIIINVLQRNSELPIVLIVTGPCGVGKTTISKMIAEKLGFIHISGDDIKKKLYPEVERITDFPNKLEKVKQEIFRQTESNFRKGKKVVVDYVILGEEQINKYRKVFADELVIKVLFPEKKMIIERDVTRECWTAGKKSVDDLCNEFSKLRDLIGAENFIDNSNETPEQTFLKHLCKL